MFGPFRPLLRGDGVLALRPLDDNRDDTDVVIAGDKLREDLLNASGGFANPALIDEGVAAYVRRTAMYRDQLRRLD